ncbi:MAG: diacylglycerol/lipid kinase family protein [Phycisphaerales bacterium]
MRLLLLSNPRSGSRRGPRLAATFAEHLARAGFELDAADVRSSWVERLAGAAALLVAGGDGSVLHALDAACRTSVPIYHIPSGNENLFAREFGHTRDPIRAAAALRQMRTVAVDLGRVTAADGWTSPFSMMCSFGPDASVVHRLEAARPAGGGHLVYARPIVAELLSPAIPRLRVEVDGKELVGNERGVLIVANGRQYAVGINPARDASMTDGLVDVVFLPARGRFDTLAWAARCRTRADLTSAGAFLSKGREVVVEPTEGLAHAQLEGEVVRSEVAPGRPLTIRCDPGVLRVVQMPSENQ